MFEIPAAKRKRPGRNKVFLVILLPIRKKNKVKKRTDSVTHI